MSRKQLDDALSKYYMINDAQYYSDNIGKFSEWCQNNGYDTDKIADELDTDFNSQLQPETRVLLEFDPNFPSSETSADTMEALKLKILKKCWSDPYAFILESIMYQKQDPNVFILQYLMDKQRLAMDGYLRQQIFINTKDGLYAPKDIINLCLSFFELDIKSMYKKIETKSGGKSSKTEINHNYFGRLCSEMHHNKTCFIAYTLASMLLSECENGAKMKASLYFKRATVLLQWNLLNKAAVDIKLAIEYNPENPDYTFAFGMLLYKECKYEAALEKYMHCVKTKNKWRYHCAATRCCIKLNNLEDARFHINKSMELEPNNYHVCFTYAVFMRDFSKNYNESEIYYQKCLKIDDTKCDINTSYGYLLYLMCKYDEARKYLEIALEIGERNKINNVVKWIYYYFALMNKKLGDETQANIWLNKAIQSIEKPSDMLLHLSKIMETDPENTVLHKKFEFAIKQL